MAHPIGFPEANDIIGRPPGMTAEECSSLELFRDGQYCVSRWQFTDEEIEELKRNSGKCYVMVMGATQPPVMITSISPFTYQDASKK